VRLELSAVDNYFVKMKRFKRRFQVIIIALYALKTFQLWPSKLELQSVGH